MNGMGEEIQQNSFIEADFEHFKSRLAKETQALKTWFELDRFAKSPLVLGCEIEAWVIAPSFNAVPQNQALLNQVNDPLVVPELSKFNIEINTEPANLAPKMLSQLEAQTKASWQHIQNSAKEIDLQVLAIGTLPTLQHTQLNESTMSSRRRYLALNEQVLLSRHHRDLTLDIHGEDRLKVNPP